MKKETRVTHQPAVHPPAGNRALVELLYSGGLRSAEVVGLDLDLVVVRALAKEPSERYQSASALREALRGYMLTHSLQSSPEQLRGLLAERFDEPRRAVRQRIDQRLKEVREEDEGLSPAVAAHSFSETSHAFVTASQHVLPSTVQLIRKRRLALMLAASIAGVGAGLSGAMAVRADFTDAVLKDAEIAISMDGKGAWRDTVFVERLWRTVKYEEVYLRAYAGVTQARASIGRYLSFYNGKRPHSSLGGQTPDQAYTNLPTPIPAAA